ncbi:MAG TPA: TraR/DksA family transcriptional regulator [Candidatus Binatia bacterium]|nr:TraR/DksA family transcriptional regulator [Candidatus Binatia bacterium]
MTDVRARLQRERELVVARLRELGVVVRESAPGLDGIDPARDLADQVQANTRRELGLLTRERLLERATRLQGALQRLHDGTYGLCVECGEPVAPARLNAIPEVETCRPCQERLEEQAA